MAAKDVAKAWQSLTQAQAAELALNQAYTLASRSGMSDDMRAQFRILDELLSEHRSQLQQAASDSLADC